MMFIFLCIAKIDITYIPLAQKPWKYTPKDVENVSPVPSTLSSALYISAYGRCHRVPHLA